MTSKFRTRRHQVPGTSDVLTVKDASDKGECKVHDWPTKGMPERLMQALRDQSSAGVDICPQCLSRVLEEHAREIESAKAAAARGGQGSFSARYVQYARAHGRAPGEQLDRDQTATVFHAWVTERLDRWREEAGRWAPMSAADETEFQAWLEADVDAELQRSRHAEES